MKSTILLVLLISSFYLLQAKIEIAGNVTVLERSERQVNSLPLVYPYGAIFKLIIGLSVPIEVSDGINIGFGMNMQFQYGLFSNISELSQYYFIKTVSRQERELDWAYRRDERIFFYRAFENLIDSRGMNGRECVLRAICEAAQFPVEDEGLVGEIMHILLTPDYGRSAFDHDEEWENVVAPFKDAAVAGRQMFDCPSIFHGCPEGQGFLEMVTLLVDQ